MSMRAQAGEISITSLGMATALGPTMADSCAAFRAGIRRTRDLNTVDLGEEMALGEEPIAACRAAYLAEGYCAGAKTVLLGGLAITDLMRCRPLDGDGGRTGIVLHLSDCFLLDAVAEPQATADDLPSAQWRQECSRLIPRMLAGCGLSVPAVDRHLSFGAHSGFVAALQAGAEMVAGGVDRCLVGAVDSCLDPEFVLAAAVKGMLKTTVNPVGFVPGEAAAFALLERTDDVRRAGASPMASFRCGPLVPGAFDRFSDKAPDGSVIARAIRAATTGAGQTEIGLVVGDLNGEEYRARDWGSALARLGSRSVAEAPLWIPALGFGETGSAAGGVGLCLATRAIERGLVHGAALVSLADDRGAAAALMVTPAK